MEWVAPSEKDAEQSWAAKNEMAEVLGKTPSGSCQRRCDTYLDGLVYS